jgi:hypothetical protein
MSTTRRGLTEFSAGIRLLAVLLSSSVHIQLWQELKDRWPEASGGIFRGFFLFDHLRLTKAS